MSPRWLLRLRIFRPAVLRCLFAYQKLGASITKGSNPTASSGGRCTLNARRTAIEQNVVSIGAQSAPSLVVLRAVAIVVLHGGLQGSSAGRLSKVESADGAGEEQSPA
jgi:hypothetical protein